MEILTAGKQVRASAVVRLVLQSATNQYALELQILRGKKYFFSLF